MAARTTKRWMFVLGLGIAVDRAAATSADGDESPSACARAAGRYCGFTNQGKSICVTVAPDSGRVTTYRLGAAVDCGSESGTFSLRDVRPRADPDRPDVLASSR